MDKDNEIKELKKYNNHYLDWINTLEKRINSLEKELMISKRQTSNQLLDFQNRLHVIEKILEDYHLT